MQKIAHSKVGDPLTVYESCALMHNPCPGRLDTLARSCQFHFTVIEMSIDRHRVVRWIVSFDVHQYIGID